MAVRAQLVVGLGNPGARYEATRHNAGFWCADRLASRLGVEFRPARRFALEVCEAPVPGGGIRLAKPTTFMNRSGQAVGAIADYFRIEPAAIVVVHDELDLPPGTARIKEGGGHGGHNGLRDLVAHLGSRDFVRIRLGIGHPGRADDVLDYVLHRPSGEDRERIDAAIERVLEISTFLFAGDRQRAMTALHTKRDAVSVAGEEEPSGRTRTEGEARGRAIPGTMA